MKIKLLAARGTGLNEIIDRCRIENIKIVDKDEDITIFINKDEYQRAKRLAEDVEQKNLIKLHRDPRHIPEVWNKILEDNEKYTLVECDYYINGNRYLEDIVNAIEHVSLINNGGSKLKSMSEELTNSEPIIREQTRVYLNKNKDYGDSFIEQLEKYGDTAFNVVAGFKLSRITQLYEGNDLENESAADSYLDLMNYLVMYAMWKNNKPKLKDFVELLGKITHVNDFITSLDAAHALKLKEEAALIEVYKEMSKYNE